MTTSTWSGPCAGCGTPTDVPFGDDLICDDCLDDLMGEPDEACVKCGCTDHRACVTAVGPCGWVPGAEKPTCTACASGAPHLPICTCAGCEAGDSRLTTTEEQHDG
jgi:hypothetical protein